MRMDDLLAAALAQLTVQDEAGAAVSFRGLWAERTVVLAFVRHLGCIFCRQQVAGLTKRLPEIERRGATLVVVAPLEPRAHRRLPSGHRLRRRALRRPVAARVPDRGARARLGQHLSLRERCEGGAWRSSQGFRQSGRQGDVVQQGGTFVLGPGDRLRYEWRDRFAGDNANLDEVVEAIPTAAAVK